MSWNGAGVFNRIYSWVADRNAGIDISSSRMDADTNDITSNGFGNTLTRDGQGSASANLPMNNFRHTGVGNALARTDYAALGQVQDGVGINWSVAAGTSDAIAVTLTPAVTALVDGQLVFARASAANATTTPTLAVNGTPPETITKFGGRALVIGDIPGNLAECVFRYDLANTHWELLNPGSGFVRWAVAGGTADALTASYVPPLVALTDGQLCYVRAGAANATTTPTFAPDGLPAHTITKAGGAALIAGNIAGALAELILRYNLANTRWELLNPVEPTAPPVPATFKNLSVKVATNTTVALAADFIAVTDGTKFQTLAVSQTINLGTTGANALDTGTIAIDTFYAIWAIAKADGTTAGLASTSFTAPTMPSGYTFKARVGAVKTIHGSATLYGTWQLGRKVQYVVGLAQTTRLPLMSSGSTGDVTIPTWTAINVTAAGQSAVAPTTASLVKIALQCNSSASQVGIVAPNNGYGAFSSTANPAPLNVGDGTAAANMTIMGELLLESANIYHAASATGAGVQLICAGWEDNL